MREVDHGDEIANKSFLEYCDANDLIARVKGDTSAYQTIEGAVRECDRASAISRCAILVRCGLNVVEKRTCL